MHTKGLFKYYLINFGFFSDPPTDHHLPPLTITDRHLPSLTLTDRHWPSLTVTYPHWPSLTTTDHYWPSLTATDRHWPSLIATDRHWPPLTATDLYWPPMSIPETNWSSVSDILFHGHRIFLKNLKLLSVLFWSKTIYQTWTKLTTQSIIDLENMYPCPYEWPILYTVTLDS